MRIFPSVTGIRSSGAAATSSRRLTGQAFRGTSDFPAGADLGFAGDRAATALAAIDLTAGVDALARHLAGTRAARHVTAGVHALTGDVALGGRRAVDVAARIDAVADHRTREARRTDDRTAAQGAVDHADAPLAAIGAARRAGARVGVAGQVRTQPVPSGALIALYKTVVHRAIRRAASTPRSRGAHASGDHAARREGEQEGEASTR